MNTKLTFCIIEMHNGGDFVKVIYKMVTRERFPLEDKHKALYWLEDEGIIKKLQDESYASMFMDFYVLKIESTKDKVCEAVDIERIKGSLKFTKSDYEILTPSVYTKRKEQEKETKELPAKYLDLLKKYQAVLTKYMKVLDPPGANDKVEKERKVYPSIWMEPNGTTHSVGFAQHEEWAQHYYTKLNGEHYTPKRYGGYAYEDLVEEGWVRVLGWTDPPTWDLPKTIISLQRKAIRGYCQDNSCNLPFKESV